MSAGTTRRTVRIEDGLWEAAKGLADKNGENLSEVIRRALMEYVEKGSGMNEWGAAILVRQIDHALTRLENDKRTSATLERLRRLVKRRATNKVYEDFDYHEAKLIAAALKGAGDE